MNATAFVDWPAQRFAHIDDELAKTMRNRRRRLEATRRRDHFTLSGGGVGGRPRESARHGNHSGGVSGRARRPHRRWTVSGSAAGSSIGQLWRDVIHSQAIGVRFLSGRLGATTRMEENMAAALSGQTAGVTQTGKHAPTRVEMHEPVTTGERIADAASAGIGSWRFIIIQTILVIIWVILNLVGWTLKWDPYPFILLNLMFSVQAAYTGPILLLADNRQSQKDRLTLEHAAQEAEKADA